MNGLFLQTLSTNPTYFFSVVITVILSITLHELAHGWMAIRLGDDTPITTGHMTLNPLVHMGWISFLMLATLGMAFGSMPVDWTRQRGKYAEACVAAAGPAMNLLLGLLGLLGMGLWIRFGTFDPENHVQHNAYVLLSVFGPFNIALMVFNLIPLPPLDGSHIVSNFVPAYRRLLSGEMTRGLMTAMFFALYLGGAGFLVEKAYLASDRVVVTIAGRDSFRMTAPAITEDDATVDLPSATTEPQQAP